MYDFAEVRDAHDALWSAMARRLGIAAVLSREGSPEEHWAHPELLFSQTCGYPLVHAFAGRLRVVATPSYRVEGCGSGLYASAVVVRSDAPWAELADLRGSVCAMNDRSSHSGMNALRAMIAPLAGGAPFFRDVIVTGSHAASIQHVQRGDADVCAIDAVTHALLARHRPSALDGTRILTMSSHAPALPYVTRADASDAVVASLRAALADTLRDPALASARDALALDGVVLDADYAAIQRIEAAAVALGYPQLV